MTFPKINNSTIQERIGIHQVALILAQYGIIFREISNTDIGVDGHIEYFKDDKSPGYIAAVQVKSGHSYFKDKGDHFAYYPQKKHMQYWEYFPMPVLLMLHDPCKQKVYFADARYYLSLPPENRKYTYIPIYKQNELSTVEPKCIFDVPNITPLLPMDALLKELIYNDTGNSDFPINFFELFTGGLSNRGRHSFFSMSMVLQLIELKRDLSNPPHGYGMGGYDYSFLNNYVEFVYTQRLIKIDYSDYLIDWREKDIVPEYMAPLTQRGHELLEYILQIEKDIFGDKGSSMICGLQLKLTIVPTYLEKFQKIFEFSKKYAQQLGAVDRQSAALLGGN